VTQGGCFCGFIRYEAAGTGFSATNCHCSICRRTSGAPFVAWVSFARDGFRFVAGQPTSFRSSDHGTRTFCPRCGTPLTFASDRAPQEVDVTTSSLDHPALFAPEDHTWTSAKLPWVATRDLPSFPEGRTP
jgi:hypothetical protein